MLVSLLLPVVLGTRWTRTAEPWVAGPSPYPLGQEAFVERIIWVLSDDVRGRGIDRNILS